MICVTPEMLAQIERILVRGGTVEIKKTSGKIDVVEVNRQVKITTPITG